MISMGERLDAEDCSRTCWILSCSITDTEATLTDTITTAQDLVTIRCFTKMQHPPAADDQTWIRLPCTLAFACCSLQSSEAEQTCARSSSPEPGCHLYTKQPAAICTREESAITVNVPSSNLHSCMSEQVGLLATGIRIASRTFCTEHHISEISCRRNRGS